MTSQVKVSAHCATNKEVVIKVFNVANDSLIEEFVLQDGESREVLIYDDRAVATHERVKEAVAE
jgi:O-glycosyl hydrolase